MWSVPYCYAVPGALRLEVPSDGDVLRDPLAGPEAAGEGDVGAHSAMDLAVCVHVDGQGWRQHCGQRRTRSCQQARPQNLTLVHGPRVGRKRTEQQRIIKGIPPLPCWWDRGLQHPDQHHQCRREQPCSQAHRQEWSPEPLVQAMTLMLPSLTQKQSAPARQALLQAGGRPG